MKFKTFEEHISEWSDDRDYKEPIRDEDWIDKAGAEKRIKYKFLWSDYSDVAFVLDKEGIPYVVNIFLEDMNPYRLRFRYAIKTAPDEWDYEDSDLEDIDDDAIVAFASDTDPKTIAKGFEEWENSDSRLAICDKRILDEVDENFKVPPDIMKKLRDVVEKKRGQITGKSFGV